MQACFRSACATQLPSRVAHDCPQTMHPHWNEVKRQARYESVQALCQTYCSSASLASRCSSAPTSFCIEHANPTAPWTHRFRSVCEASYYL